MGVVEIHAGKGSVVHYEGFEKTPIALQPLPVSKAALAAAKGRDGKAGTKPPGAKPVENAGPPPKSKTEKTVEKPAVEKPVAERPPAEKPVAESSVPTEKPIAEKPVVERSLAEKSLAERSVPNQKPAPVKPIERKALPEKPALAGDRNHEPAPKKSPPPVAEPPKAVPVARVVPEATPTPAPGTVKRIGNSVKRLFNRDE
jgi:protein TonB